MAAAEEKAAAAETLRLERCRIGAVKSRQRLAEEKSLARSQLSRAGGSTFGTTSSAAFASGSSRFDRSTEEAIKYVNPELRAQQRQPALFPRRFLHIRSNFFLHERIQIMSFRLQLAHARLQSLDPLSLCSRTASASVRIRR